MTQNATKTPSVSADGLMFIMRHESFLREPIGLSDGTFVSGYGHVTAVKPAESISETLARAWLRADLEPVERALSEGVSRELPQHQVDALISFSFSTGPSAFAGSDVLDLIKSGDMLGAAGAMMAWRNPAAGDASASLIVRRAEEVALFLAGAQPQPSALLRPTRSPTAPAVDADLIAQRLLAILAANSATAALLAPGSAPMPRPAPAISAPSVERTLRSPTWTARDSRTGVILAIAAVGISAAGLVAITQERPHLFLLFTAPGAIMAAMAANALLRHRGNGSQRVGT